MRTLGNIESSGADYRTISMSWFSKKKRLRTSPIMIAELLHGIMAEEDNPQAAPEAFHLPDTVHDRFRDKVFLYREAIVLLALLIRAKQDSLFEPALQEYEHILFPESPGTPAGTKRLQAVKAAMQDLQALMDPQDTHKLTWGRNWFSAIGYDETNPATLMLFFTFWSNLNAAIHRSLDGMIA